MKKPLPVLLLVTFLLLSSKIILAQQSTVVGINFTTETSGNQLRPGLGLTLERRLTKKSGIETGVYYRTFGTNDTYIFYNGTQFVPYTVILIERFISIPLLYKFHSRLINASAGISFDFYTGFRHKNKSQELSVNTYNIDPNMGVGFQVKLSKPIRLDEKLILEPELRLNPVITYNRAYGGLGITAKYRLK